MRITKKLFKQKKLTFSQNLQLNKMDIILQSMIQSKSTPTEKDLNKHNGRDGFVRHKLRTQRTFCRTEEQMDTRFKFKQYLFASLGGTKKNNLR